MAQSHLKIVPLVPISSRIVAAIDDDPSVHLFLSSYLGSLGIQFEGYQSPLEAIESLRDFRADLILVDFQMPEVNGLDLTRFLAKRSPNTPIVLMTAFATIEVAVEAMRAGAQDLIEKETLAPKLLALLSEGGGTGGTGKKS